VVENPAGDRAVSFQLQPSNSQVAGFSGCNRMFGRYALEGASLKFDGLGGTRMFCENGMALEQRFVGMFQNVAGWKITGNMLQLLDGEAQVVATFSTP
jgi:heat shock protein HslJ